MEERRLEGGGADRRAANWAETEAERTESELIGARRLDGDWKLDSG